MSLGVAAQLYLDGSYASTLTGIATIPSKTDPLYVGNLYNGQLPAVGSLFQRVTLLNRALSPADISQLYQELMSERFPLRAYSFASRNDVALATRSMFEINLNRIPVTLANMVGPREVAGAPLRINNGTWKVSEDAAGKHWVESVATDGSSFYAPCTRKDGTFVFEVYHTTASEMVHFVSNARSIADAGRNAYGVYLDGAAISLTKYEPAGASTVLCSSSNAIAVNNKYKVAVTRATGTGEFTLWLKSGASWAKVAATSGANPVTNNDYTTSSYFTCATTTAANAGKFGNVDMFQGVLTSQQLREKC